MTQPFPSAVLLQSARSEDAVLTTLSSPAFTGLVATALAAVPNSVGGADALFSQYAPPLMAVLPAHWQILAWEQLLSSLRAADPSKYDQIHKGTAFYFIGVACYQAQAFQKALHYVDAALGEDMRAPNASWQTTPAGYFTLLDPQPPKQVGRPLVNRIATLFTDWSAQIAAAGGTSLTLSDYRTRFAVPAVNGPLGFRSLVTAFLSYLLEYDDRQTELALVPLSSTTGESVYLHLFRGALLFESLLRASPAGAAVVAGTATATLDTFLRSRSIYVPLGFSSQPQGLGGSTLDDVFSAIAADATSGLSYDQRAIRAAWGLRNKTGHNLAWPARPADVEHENAARLISCAHAAIIARLW